MADTWNPDQYARFADERGQAFYDLLALVQRRPGMRVIDLGCGSGELTAHLHEHLRAARTIGLDNSPKMLEKAAQQARDGLEFRAGDIGAFEPAETFDLVFSNAALQWVGDPEKILARIAGWL